RHAGAMLLLAKAARGAGDEDGALAWATWTLEAEPACGEALGMAQTVLTRGGLRDEANAWAARHNDEEKVVRGLENLKAKMAPGRLAGPDANAASLRHEAGLAALRLGLREEARLWFWRALVEDPGHAEARQALASLPGPDPGEEEPECCRGRAAWTP